MSTLPNDEARSDAARIGQLLGGVRELAEVIHRIGPPDRDTANQVPVITGKDVPRILVWCRVSPYWAVVVHAWSDGRFNSQCQPIELWNS